MKRIKRITQWQYRPNEDVGIKIFGWCLVVVGYRYYIDGKEVKLYES